MGKSKLLNDVRTVLRYKHYSPRTEKNYIHWIKDFIFFNNKKHPDTMGENEIRNYINYLAVERRVSASTQNQALNAILFLYKNVTKKEIGWIENIERVRRKRHIPVVFSQIEAKKIIDLMEGIPRLVVSLLYGSGLRLIECLRLRIKDIDFDYRQIVVRDGKGEKDRITLLPESQIPDIRRQIQKVRHMHEIDLKNNLGETKLPYALKKKYKNAGKELGWQYVFPASKFVYDKDSNLKFRYHIHTAWGI